MPITSHTTSAEPATPPEIERLATDPPHTRDMAARPARKRLTALKPKDRSQSHASRWIHPFRVRGLAAPLRSAARAARASDVGPVALVVLSRAAAGPLFSPTPAPFALRSPPVPSPYGGAPTPPTPFSAPLPGCGLLRLRLRICNSGGWHGGKPLSSSVLLTATGAGRGKKGARRRLTFATSHAIPAAAGASTPGGCGAPISPHPPSAGAPLPRGSLPARKRGPYPAWADVVSAPRRGPLPPPGPPRVRGASRTLLAGGYPPPWPPGPPGPIFHFRRTLRKGSPRPGNDSPPSRSITPSNASPRASNCA